MMRKIKETQNLQKQKLLPWEMKMRINNKCCHYQHNLFVSRG